MSIKPFFKTDELNFKAGRVSYCVQHWRQVTSDKLVIDMVQGLHIELLGIPHQNVLPDSQVKDLKDAATLSMQVGKMLDQVVIEPAYPCNRAFV